MKFIATASTTTVTAHAMKVFWAAVITVLPVMITALQVWMPMVAISMLFPIARLH